MKYLIYLFAIVLSVALFFVWYVNATPEPVDSVELLNKNAPADYRARPDSYEAMSPSLFRLPLSKIELNAEGTTRFEKVADSGVTFKNYFDRNRPRELIDTGSGVAIGDYDNDGLPDVYLVGCDVDSKLYRNLGDFKFENVTELAGVNGRFRNQNLWGAGASFADVDNDGDLDLFVCNMAGPNLLYINQGDGTFSEQAYLRNVAYVGASKVANFCDYDRDGDLDIYLVTYQDQQPDRSVDPVEIVNGKKQIREDMRDQYAIVGEGTVKAGEKDILYRNNGDGTFEDVTEAAGIVDYGTTLSSVWFDHNGDGWPDVYASNDFHAPDRLWQNNGDGTFTDVLPSVVKHTPWFSMGVDAGDINNDGLEDLITTDMSGTSHYRRKVDMGDMGDSSFFLTYGRPRQYMKNALFVNSGVGPFLEIAAMSGMSSTDWTWAPRLVDLNNDGRLDAYFTNGHARDIMNADVTKKLEAFGNDKKAQIELEAFYTKIPVRKETNLAFENIGDLNFRSVGPEWGLNHHGVSHGAAFSDLDGDGDLDLVVNNYYERALIYRNETTSGSRLLFEFRCDDNNFFGLGTKVEIWQGGKYQTRMLRSVRGYLSSDGHVTHFGCSSDSVVEKVRVTWPDNTTQVFEKVEPNYLYRVVEDSSREPAAIPSDAKPQFVDVSARVKADFRHAETPYDDFARENLLPFKLSELGSGIAWADVNGDSYPDLFCGGAAGQAGELFVNESGKSFRKIPGPWQQDATCEDMGVLFFDADGDGDEDLYVVSGSNECEANSKTLSDRLYINSGSGKFKKAAAGSLPNIFDSGSGVAAADFDRDGDLDLFVGSRAIPGRYPETPQSRLLRNDEGKFTDVTEELALGLIDVGLVNSGIWSDFDNDGWIDLILAMDWGPVTVFRNDNGKLSNQTSELNLADVKGWWHGISAADLDDDGDVDYVVTNQGQNTKYHADRKHPHRIYFSDFDNSGTLDLVETEFENGVEYPARGLSCSSNSMPFIGDKFETYHEFATATLDDIYDPSIRTKPFREVNFLDSAILWNEADGKSKQRFRVESLPRVAQVSPAFGVAIADFNGDSKQDVFIGNNFFASQPETGFMDGGLSLLLEGRGDGNFRGRWPNESGIAIDAPSYGVAMADFDRDGDIDIAVSANNERLRLLANQSNNAPLKVSLLGKAANRKAIGARVTFQGPKFQRAIEIVAGDSYLSQSTISDIALDAELASLVEQVSVRWPDGEESTHPFNGEATESLLLRHPSLSD